MTAVWKTLCKLSQPLLPPAMGTRLPFFWASLPRGPAGLLAMLLIKTGHVETNRGPTTTQKQVWICDICHRQIHVRKQISIRCNKIEHWVHLRCADIRLAQYTDTWTCHQHKESRLTTHTDITPPTLPNPGPNSPPTHPNTTHTTATKTQTHIPLSPCSSRIVKAQSSHPLTHSPNHPQSLTPRPSQTHTHVTHSTYTSHHTHL